MGKSNASYSEIVDKDITGRPKKPNNWPRSCPIIRFDIEDDFPRGFHGIGRVMFFQTFYTAIILFVNFLTATTSFFFLPGYYYTTDAKMSNFILSIIWLVVFTSLSFVLFRSFYKAVSQKNSFHLKVFLVGTTFDVIVAILAFFGPPFTGFMGVFNALIQEKWIIAPCIIISIAFFVKAVLLITVLVLVGRQRKAIRADNSVIVEDGDVISSNIGTIDALPADIEGRKIKYLTIDAFGTYRSKVEKLNTLPVNSFTIISEWRKVDSDYDESYILYVENEPGRAYWSNPHVAGIINNGYVNPMTQVLTISRLSDGSFAFGVADKEAK